MHMHFPLRLFLPILASCRCTLGLAPLARALPFCYVAGGLYGVWCSQSELPWLRPCLTQLRLSAVSTFSIYPAVYLSLIQFGFMLFFFCVVFYFSTFVL